MDDAMQGIMALPQAQGSQPPIRPEQLAVFEQMRQQIPPKEFGDELLSAASQADPQAVEAFKQELSTLEVPLETLQMLNEMVDAILASPQDYASIRREYMRQGVTEDLLPPQFDPAFFAALNMALDQLTIKQPQAPMQMAGGGIASLAQYGRHGDTMLAHITPDEAAMLKRMGGSGTTNPVTGLPEFGNIFSSIGKAVKKFASSTVGKIVTTVALGFFLGPTAAAMLNVSAPAAVMAVQGFVGGAGSTLLAGGSLKESLKAGAIGGITAGALQGITGGAAAFQPSTTPLPTISEQFSKFTNMLSPSAPAAAPQTLVQTEAPIDLARSSTLVDDFVGPSIPESPTTSNYPMGSQTPAPIQPEPPVQMGGKSIPYSEYQTMDLKAPSGPQGYLDQAKDFYSKNISPSGIQQAGEAAAQKAGTDAMAALQARLPSATPQMLETAYQTAYKAALPGMLATYGPMAGVALAGTAALGGFKTPKAEMPLGPQKTGADLLQSNPELYRLYYGGIGGGQRTYNPYLQPMGYAPPPRPPGMANGGVASLPAYAEGGQHFPRKTGPINGPGTGTSDSIPAMLSDGEFVFTAKAVRAMGHGSRRKGAKRLYSLMKALEKRSAR